MNKLYAIYSTKLEESHDGKWELVRRYKTPESCEQAYNDIINKPLGLVYVILPASWKHIKIETDMNQQLLNASKP